MNVDSKSNKLTANFSTGMLMRVGSKERLEKCYREKKLEFSCAANWVDYAQNGNSVTGDYLECIFAHVNNDDPRLSDLRDFHGLPLGNHIEILRRSDDQTSYLRYTPTLMVPALCFFSFGEKLLSQKADGLMPTLPRTISFDLGKYRASMKYAKDEAAFLFITDPCRFFEDLRCQVKKAIRNNSDYLTTERYYSNGMAVDLFCNEVDYHKYNVDELFYDDTHVPSEELFWKTKKYEWQHEVRVIIANINFKSLFGVGKYDYRKCYLEVELPRFQEYSEIYSAADVERVHFYKLPGQGDAIFYSIC